MFVSTYTNPTSAQPEEDEVVLHEFLVQFGFECLQEMIHLGIVPEQERRIQDAQLGGNFPNPDTGDAGAVELPEADLPHDVLVLALHAAGIDLESEAPAAFFPYRGIIFPHHVHPRGAFGGETRELDGVLLRGRRCDRCRA